MFLYKTIFLLKPNTLYTISATNFFPTLIHKGALANYTLLLKKSPNITKILGINQTNIFTPDYKHFDKVTKIKILNLFISGGQKEKVIPKFIKAFNTFLENSNTHSIFRFLTYFKTFIFFIENFKKTSGLVKQSFLISKLTELDMLNFYYQQSHFFTKHFITNLITIANPIFSFTIQKVNKNLQKYSRGRSGKYTLVWQYLSNHNRYKKVYSWVKKDINLQKIQKLTKRIMTVFEVLNLKPTLSFLYKLRRFTNKYVFKNFKESLL